MPNLNGSDILGGFDEAARMRDNVKDDITGLARDARKELQILKGDERQEFFTGLRPDELVILRDLAQGQGPRGMVALERVLREAQEVRA